jgi:hypothetical protein
MPANGEENEKKNHTNADGYHGAQWTASWIGDTTSLYTASAALINPNTLCCFSRVPQKAS